MCDRESSFLKTGKCSDTFCIIFGCCSPLCLWLSSSLCTCIKFVRESNIFDLMMFRMPLSFVGFERFKIGDICSSWNSLGSQYDNFLLLFKAIFSRRI